MDSIDLAYHIQCSEKRLGIFYEMVKPSGVRPPMFEGIELFNRIQKVCFRVAGLKILLMLFR